MQNLLAKEIYLCPEDLLQFQPEDAEELPNGTFNVYGTVMHKEWDDTPWDMTLYGVTKLQYRAYKECDWLVRPIGMCAAHTFDRTNAAVLGQLIHCDWDSYAKSQAAEREPADEKEEDSPDTQRTSDGRLLVPGPSGCMIQWAKLQPMLQKGCINCGMDLEQEDVRDLLEVNNGQDLICLDCTREMMEGTASPILN